MTKKGFATVFVLVGLLLLIIVLTIVAGGAYYFSQNYFSKYPETVTKSVDIPNSSSKSESWSTYSNLNQGFSVDYPSSWSVISYHRDWKSFVQVPTDFNYESTIVLAKNLNKAQLEKSYGVSPGVEIKVFNPQKCTNSKDYINENLHSYQESYKNDPGFKIAYSNFKVDDLNVKGLDGFIVTGLPGPGGRESLPTAYIFNCPTLITILFDGSDIPDGTKLFHQILSTIRLWKPVKFIPG